MTDQTVVPFLTTADRCPRCGAHEQGMHHRLCQYRDGTPTPLSDATVREVVAFLDQQARELEESFRREVLGEFP